MELKTKKDDIAHTKLENYHRLLDINLTFNEKILEEEDEIKNEKKELIITIKLYKNSSTKDNKNINTLEGKKILNFNFINKIRDSSL